MNLSKAEIDILIAIHRLQPVTRAGLQSYLNREPGHLAELMDLGLIYREKWSPPKLDYGPQKTGKRPYLYKVTPRAERAVEALAQAFELIDQLEDEA